MDADVTQRIIYRPAVLRQLRDGHDVRVEYLGSRRQRPSVSDALRAVVQPRSAYAQIDLVDGRGAPLEATK